MLQLTEQLVEAWRINNRVNLLLIESIKDAGMRCTLSKRGGRNVVRQFAHIHYVRISQLKHRASSLAKGARVFGTHEEPDRRALAAALLDSSQRIEQWIRLASDRAPSIRTFKRGLVPTITYLIAHESHHRGSILLTLKQCGQRIDTFQYAIWDWDKI